MDHSTIQGIVYGLGHGIDGRIELLLDHHHVLLVVDGDEVDGEPDLAEAATAADPVQVGRGILGEVEVNDDVDTGHIDSSGDQVGADESLELSPPEALEDLQPFVLHVGRQVLVLKPLAFHLFGQELRPLVGPAEDYALVDDQFAVDLVEILQLFGFLHQDVVVGESQQHELVHEVDHSSLGHEVLLEALDAQGECGRVQIQGSLLGQVADYILDIVLCLVLQQTVGFVQHEELALI